MKHKLFIAGMCAVGGLLVCTACSGNAEVQYRDRMDRLNVAMHSYRLMYGYFPEADDNRTLMIKLMGEANYIKDKPSDSDARKLDMVFFVAHEGDLNERMELLGKDGYPLVMSSHPNDGLSLNDSQ